VPGFSAVVLGSWLSVGCVFPVHQTSTFEMLFKTDHLPLNAVIFVADGYQLHGPVFHGHD